ncbi:cytochrome c3 family protein [Akkermansia sp.]|uniref:cytochrome c3 family protein n=1 Tax=Akkermansia sp. TaxID=1872421 RepID=UPI003AEFF156
MANIFPPNANRRFYGIIALGMLVLALILGGVYYLNFYVKEHAPVQPVRFSHKLHAGDLKMGCTSCHAAALRSPRTGIPDTKSCLGCHQHILPNSPLIAPLRAAADPQFPGYTGEPVRWVMVNRLSGHAYFNHMAHLNRGIGCTSCHEDAAGMEVMKAPRDARMRWCLDCHRNPVPHLRPLEEAASSHYSAADYLRTHSVHDEEGRRISTQHQLGEYLKRQWKIQPKTDCSTCHH